MLPVRQGVSRQVCQLSGHYREYLQLCQGDKVALVGPNGAGKSTLMLHLNGILTGQGILTIAGLPLIESNLPLIRAAVGLVFQNPDDQLFSPTVFDDVAYGPLYHNT